MMLKNSENEIDKLEHLEVVIGALLDKIQTLKQKKDYGRACHITQSIKCKAKNHSEGLRNFNCVFMVYLVCVCICS